MFPRRLPHELNLIYKGKDLKEMIKTLKEVCTVQPILMIVTAKSEIELEYESLECSSKIKISDE